MSWLSDIKFIDHHTFSRERRQEKTGQWLEENETYKEWKNSKSSSLLWLRGDGSFSHFPMTHDVSLLKCSHLTLSRIWKNYFSVRIVSEPFLHRILINSLYI